MKRCLSNPKRESILITGSSGFVGLHMKNYLGKKYDLACVALEGAGDYIKLDLRDRKKARSYLQGLNKKIDIIIHMASRLTPADKTEDMDTLYDNMKMAESIVDIARLVKPKKIINFSSIAVYPNTDGIHDEISEVRPSANTECLYGLSKFCSENIIDFFLRNTDIIITHLRISQIYGDGMRRDRVMSMMADELKRTNRITVFGNGERISNFIGIDRLLEMVDLFIRKDLKGTFNIGGEHMSYLELAERIIQKYGDKRSKIIKKAQGSRSKFYLNTDKMKRVRK